jgi:hypothetical protein
MYIKYNTFLTSGTATCEIATLDGLIPMLWYEIDREHFLT